MTIQQLNTIHILNVPMYVNISNKKIKPLNLNEYRNQHHFSSNNQKINFLRIVKPQIMKLPKMKKIKIAYTIYPKSKRSFDIGNVGAIVDKFFCDALVKCDVISDDNYQIVTEITQRFGGFTNDEAHVMVEITDLTNESEQEMKVILEQHDLINAIKTYALSEFGFDCADISMSKHEDGTYEAEVMFGKVNTTTVQTNTITETSKSNNSEETEEEKQERLYEKAVSLGIKYLRKNSSIETIESKLEEYYAENSGVDDDSSNNKSSSPSSSQGPSKLTTSIFTSSEDKEEKTVTENPSEGVQEESSTEDTEGTPKTETLVEDDVPAPVRKTSIFDT